MSNRDHKSPQTIFWEYACNGCSKKLSYQALPKHHRDCLYRLAACSKDDCNKVLPLKYLKLHEEKCKYRLVSCDLWDDQIRDLDQDRHYNTECKHTYQWPECLNFDSDHHQWTSYLTKKLDRVNSRIVENELTHETDLKLKDTQIKYLKDSLDQLSLRLSRFENIFKVIPGYLDGKIQELAVNNQDLANHDHTEYHGPEEHHKHKESKHLHHSKTNEFDNSAEFYSWDGYESDAEGIKNLMIVYILIIYAMSYY